MLTVTDGALDRLSVKLAGKNAPQGAAMRFIRKKNGWKLCLDQARPDDTAFAHQGINVLLLDAVVGKAMATLTLDARDTKKGTRLKLHRIKRKTD